MLSVILAAMTNQSASYVAGEQVPRAQGDGHARMAPYGCYATAKGTLVLAVCNDKQFGLLRDVWGLSTVAQDERFQTNELRVRNRASLREALERALATNSAAYWSSVLLKKGIAAGAVNNIAQAFALAEQLGLSPIRNTADGDDVGRQVASPINLSTTPVTYRTRAPRLGEHTDEIRDWLGVQSG